MSKRADTVVVGGGPGGYAAAFKASDLGQKVILVDPLENPGGVCLHWGCIPTKALLHVVKVKDEAREARNWGLTFSEPKVDIDQLRGFKDGVIKKLTGGLGQLVKQRKIDHIHGLARFTSESTLTVALNEGGEEEVSFEHAIIATGASPISLPNVDIESDRILYAKSALELEEIPESLLVVGGGYIGLELGSVFGKLGCEVTVVEMTDGIMPGADRDLVKVFEQANEGEVFKEVLTSTVVDAITESGDGLQVTMKSADGDKGANRSATFSKVLLTVGHRPNTAHLGLEEVGVETTERGFVKVDDQRRTNVNNVFAVGDVTGPPLLAHKANREGQVAAEVITGRKSAYDPATIPAVEYTNPEIAWCGVTEREAEQQGLDVEITSFPWAASGRALAMGTAVGKTKLIVDRKSERVLGVGIVGKDAGELISEGVLAVEMGALAEDLALSVHPHPTLSETIMEAAELFYGSATHVFRRRK
ncbi:MAG: dihydrolipoyl dehydrogenase [Alkalispirochaetaceae bacterium]